MTIPVSPTPTNEVIADQGGLRKHLDALNNAGVAVAAAGIDSVGQPFLIALTGIYAESEDVFFDSPWALDRDYGERIDGQWVPLQPRCVECQGMAHGIGDLRYPVTVMVQSMSADDRARYDQELAEIGELLS